MMEGFAEYLGKIENAQQRARVSEVLAWIARKFPSLGQRIAWNQPMFTDHGTFIIGFSVARHHMAVAPETAAINHFSAQIVEAGYEHSKHLFRIEWGSPLDFKLLEKIIRFNMADKADCATFWRK